MTLTVTLLKLPPSMSRDPADPVPNVSLDSGREGVTSHSAAGLLVDKSCEMKKRRSVPNHSEMSCRFRKMLKKKMVKTQLTRPLTVMQNKLFHKKPIFY